jgi:tetratricopeptide (TPR) repeat protein
MDAQTVLENAVRDAPQDTNAALALGAFRLRVTLFGDTISFDSSSKAAQIQLLQAAKMDSSQAGPFALLGYWYELMEDKKRAVGCYSKALLLDPCHPVAGRGILRLAPRHSLTKVLDKAIASGSAVVGWAWHAVSRQKAMVEGDDNMALVSLLNALRCRDLDCPSSEPLSVFYAEPSHPELPSRMELSHCLADLAACYYRLGRYTASLRSYHSAIYEAGERCSSSLLCCCAQGAYPVYFDPIPFIDRLFVF